MMYESEPPSYELVLTGKVLDWLYKDLKNLVSRPGIVFSSDPPLWAPERATPIYRPPGLWCRFTGDRSRAESRLLWWFPEPYHPLEALASMRGFVGAKSDDLPKLSAADFSAVREHAVERYAGWLRMTEQVAETLFITPAQARVLYQCFTPLLTNGCDAKTKAGLLTVSARLHDAAGLPGDFENTWSWYSPLSNTLHPNMPVRARFWGVECAGRIEL